MKSTSWSSALLLVLVLACSRGASPADRRAEADGVVTGGVANIVFVTYPLVPKGPAKGVRSVEWSQNDDADSVGVVIDAAPGSAIDTMIIELLGRERSGGDARSDAVRPLLPTMLWRQVVSVTVDTLPSTSDGHRIILLQPSELWRAFRERGPGAAFLDSVHVTLRLTNGTVGRYGLGLLFD